jgi:hypothetical protein
MRNALKKRTVVGSNLGNSFKTEKLRMMLCCALLCCGMFRSVYVMSRCAVVYVWLDMFRRVCFVPSWIYFDFVMAKAGS